MSSSNRTCGANPNFTTNSTMMGNTDKGSASSLTFGLSKPLSDNWFGSLSYTFTDADEVASDGSSQAWSSYQYVSRVNPNQEISTTRSEEHTSELQSLMRISYAVLCSKKQLNIKTYN